MLFGQSVFQSVVERLKQEKEDEGAEPPPPADNRIAGFSSGFVVDTHIEAPAAANGNLDAYLAFLEDPAPPAEPTPAPQTTVKPHASPVAPRARLGDHFQRKDTPSPLRPRPRPPGPR